MKKRFKCMILVLAISCYLSNDVSGQGTGLLFLPEDEYKAIPLASTAMLGTLPSDKDLSDWFPRPGDQGTQGSCVAWAVCYGLKSYQEAVEKRRKPHAATQVFSPSYVFNQIKISGCKNGSYIRRALDLLKREGVATLQEFPYDESDCTRLPGSSERSSAKAYAIAEWRTVPLESEIDIKSHIVNGFPVVIGMMVDEGFQRLSGETVYTGPSGKELGGHAMIVVGYNDSKGAFKVLNSWGTHWGDGGFGWISYGAFKRRVREAYSAQDIVVNDPTNIDPTPSPGPIPDVPTPVPNKNISASLLRVDVVHNVPVNIRGIQYPGMLISVPGSILNAVGSQAQVIIRFIMPNGQPLIANALEPFFRDSHGYVAVGSPILPVINNPASTGAATFGIPYYALNLISTNGTRTYQLSAVATIYINNYEKAQSPYSNMLVRY